MAGWALAAALLAPGGLAACGGDGAQPERPRPLADLSPSTTVSGDGTPAAPSAPSVEAGSAAADGPQAAYVAWLGALEDRDAATACALQHPELTIALRQEAVLLDRAGLGDPCTGFEALLWEDPLREYRPVSVETTRETGEDATLAVSFAGSEVTVRLEVQRAAWRVLAEERRTAATGATARWLDAWCALSPDDARQELVEAMGEPSGEYTVADGGEPQLWWAADQYDFRAYLDPVDGTVTDLVGDYDALSAADRARLDCPELR